MRLVFSIVAMLCFSVFCLLLDHSQKREKTDPMGLNMMSFCFGTFLGLLAERGIQPAHYPLKLLTVGFLMGLAAGFGLLGVTLAARSALSISVINTCVSLTLAIPVMLSWFFYREVPGPRKTVGLLLAVLCIFLIQRER